MRIFKGTVIVGTLLLLALAVQPVMAACGNAAILGSAAADRKSYVWTEGVFSPQYYAPYVFDYTPPWTANFAGQWWALGTGDPAPGAGDDSNTWTADNWAYFYGPGAYGSYFAGQFAAGWGQASVIDGCIANNPTGCTCILLTDQTADYSAYALLSGHTNSTGDTFYDQPGSDGAGNAGPIILTRSPDPIIVNSVKVGNGVDLQVQQAASTGGVYEKDGCNCSGGAVFRVLAQELPEGSPPPSTRDASQWTVLSADTPVGAVANASAACDVAAGVDLYVTTELVWDPVSAGGFSGGIVSANSTRISCGTNPTLADPVDVRPRVRPDKPLKPKGGRGR